MRRAHDLETRQETSISIMSQICERFCNSSILMFFTIDFNKLDDDKGSFALWANPALRMERNGRISSGNKGAVEIGRALDVLVSRQVVKNVLASDHLDPLFVGFVQPAVEAKLLVQGVSMGLDKLLVVFSDMFFLEIADDIVWHCNLYWYLGKLSEFISQNDQIL